MMDFLPLIWLLGGQQSVGGDIFHSNPHHACCRKTSALKRVRFSSQSVCPLWVGLPEDSRVVEHCSPAHPAAGFSSLTSQAHAGSTGAAHKLIVYYI